MKKINMLSILAVFGILALILSGCSTGEESAGGSKNTSNQTIEATDTNSSSSDADKNSSNGSTSSTDKSNVYQPAPIPEETQQLMNNLTGTWESATPLEDGSVSIVRVKIDNVSGFTFTTGTQMPDGNGTFYSRVGSYQLAGNDITFSATTGGESNDGSSYKLRQDPGVFKYSLSENPELTQLVLTPINEKATLLTGEGAITLAKK